MTRDIWLDFDFKNVSRILGLPDAILPQQPATLAQLNSAVEGLNWKDSVRVSTQANISLASPGATIDGITMVSGDRVLVRFQTAQPENGIYTWTGAASAMTRTLDANTSTELEQAIVTVEEGATVGSPGSSWRQNTINFVLGTGNIVWSSFGTAAPPASTSTPGIAALATQIEVNAGVVADKIVTPETLASYSGRKLKFVANIGDGSATQFDVTHNFGTRDLSATVYRNATPWDTIECDVERPNTNTTRFRFTSAPASNAYSVVIIG